MAKYNFFISYSIKDRELAQNVAMLLMDKGYTVFYDAGQLAGNWAEAIADIIRNSDCFMPLITDAFLASQWARRELIYALDTSNERGQRIIPIDCTDHGYPPAMQLRLGSCQTIVLRRPDDLQNAIDRIDRTLGFDLKSAALYEKLAEYGKLKHAIKEATTICELTELLCARWENRSDAGRRELCLELCRLLKLLEYHSCGYGAEAKALGRKMLGAIDCASALISTQDSLFLQDVFFAAFAVRIKYWAQEIRTEAMDLIYSGDVFQGLIDPCPIQRGIEVQAPFVQAFEAAFARVKDVLDSDSRFSAEEIEFIKQTPSFVLTKEKNGYAPFYTPAGKATAKTEDEEILLSVAKFMQEGNKLFDVLQQRGIAGDFLKCLLTSYERLKNYCQIVGAADVAADCVDRILEIRGAIEKQDDAVKANETAENGIKSLLGFTLQSSGSYDVFISFKNEDSDLAEKVYKLCQRHMKVPFWSKRTLPELSKSEYEDAIYDALRKSKHFVVVLSNLEYLEASWIKKEMKIFDREITEDRKPGGNFVFVVTDDVYRQIIDCNKMCLDARYCGYQIIKMSEYEKTLMQYIR